jgi:hypothetical protein
VADNKVWGCVVVLAKYSILLAHSFIHISLPFLYSHFHSCSCIYIYFHFPVITFPSTFLYSHLLSLSSIHVSYHVPIFTFTFTLLIFCLCARECLRYALMNAVHCDVLPYGVIQVIDVWINMLPASSHKCVLAVNKVWYHSHTELTFKQPVFMCAKMSKAHIWKCVLCI